MNSNIEQQVAREVIRQAQKSFDLAYFSLRLANLMTTISAGIICFGVILFLSGKTSEGSLTAASGILTGTGCMQVSKEASRQMERANKRMEKYLDSSEED